MTTYWDQKFLKHLDPKVIFEVGSRYGSESKKLKEIFPDSVIYAFECNPNTVNTCRDNLSNIPGIQFYDFGLGEKEEKLPFFSYVKDNDGASSFFKRTDFETTQLCTGTVDIKRLDNFVYENSITNIDLLCMDVQGYELNILKGAGDFLDNIKYIILEEPKKGLVSPYKGAPSSEEIKNFMDSKNFVEIERLQENMLEDNVMYIKKL